MGKRGWAYDEIDPVAAFRGDVCCYIFTSFVVLRDAKLHGEHFHAKDNNICTVLIELGVEYNRTNVTTFAGWKKMG